MLQPQHKIRIFMALCAACALCLGVYFFWPKQGAVANDRSPVPATTTGAPDAPRVLPAAADQPRQIFYRHTGTENDTANYRKLVLADASRLDQPRFIDSITCECVHFAAGRGICLTAEWGILPSYSALVFDADFKPLFTMPLNGRASRTRVSPDGRLAGVTVFLSGHSYANVEFTTETLLIDLISGKSLGSLEEFEFTRDGQRFKAADFNLWGVSFTPDSRNFYCTLSTAGKHYLVRCDVASRTGTVVHENVECPSVSPDGTRVAYKKRLLVDKRLFWQLHVLDLATLHETPLADKRSVDDQLEWLDNEHVLYTVSDNPEGSSATTNVWKADAAGKLPPVMFLRKASSPAVVR